MRDQFLVRCDEREAWIGSHELRSAAAIPLSVAAPPLEADTIARLVGALEALGRTDAADVATRVCAQHGIEIAERC